MRWFEPAGPGELNQTAEVTYGKMLESIRAVASFLHHKVCFIISLSSSCYCHSIRWDAGYRV